MLLTLLTVLSPAVASDGPALAGPPPTTTPAYEIERIPERRRLRRYGVGPAIIGGSVLMAAGAGSAVVGTQCNGSECAVLFVGALGVLPLVVASGAGAEARVVMGVALLGGMALATMLGVFFYPMLFVFIGKIAGYEKKRDLQKEQV